MYDDSRSAGVASVGNRVHRYWTALMAQYKQTGSLAPPVVAAPTASAPTAPAPTAFAPTPPETSPPQMATSSVGIPEALVAQREVAQAQLVIEKDRVRNLMADVVRLQGQLANAPSAAATQGAPFQAPLNPDDHEDTQDQEHITPGNSDESEPIAEDDDAIISV